MLKSTYRRVAVAALSFFKTVTAKNVAYLLARKPFFCPTSPVAFRKQLYEQHNILFYATHILVDSINEVTSVIIIC